MPRYTTEDLIQYLYRETSEEKSEAIAKALETDYLLNEKFKALRESKEQLNSIVVSPRPQTIQAILNYARKTTPIEQS